MDLVSDKNIRDLCDRELEEVNGGFLVNLAMGIVGSAVAMGAYSMSREGANKSIAAQADSQVPGQGGLLQA